MRVLCVCCACGADACVTDACVTDTCVLRVRVLFVNNAACSKVIPMVHCKNTKEEGKELLSIT